MRTTLNLDDKLLEDAMAATGITEKTKLIHLALQNLVAREAARQLAAEGGAMPDVQDIPRRRAS